MVLPGFPRKFRISSDADYPISGSRPDIPWSDFNWSSGLTDPGGASEGEFFYNTTSKKLKWFDGTRWVIIATLDVDQNLAIAGRYLKE